MDTNFNIMLSKIISAREWAEEEIIVLNVYIREMTELVESAIEGETISCPICQGRMMNIMPTLEVDPQLKHSGGSMSLSSSMAMVRAEYEWECQNCGVFQTEIPQKKVQSWTHDTPGGVKSLPYLVFRNFPEVVRVHAYRPTYQAMFIFEFPDMAVTYGYLNKDKIISRFEKIKGIFKYTPTKRGLAKADKLVYLMQGKEGYKIGISGDPPARLKHIKSYAPSIQLIHTFEADDPLVGETLLHKEFQTKHIGGEWFDLSDSEVEDIKFIAGFKNGKFIKERV